MRNAAQQIDWAREKALSRAGRVLTARCTVIRIGAQNQENPPVYSDPPYNENEQVVSDGDGGFIASQDVVALNIPCKYDTISPYEMQVAGTVHAGATHKLTFLPNADIKARDMVVVEPSGSIPTLVFHVIGRREAATKVLLYVDAKLDGETSNV